MFTELVDLIEQSIDDLESLSNVLKEELDERDRHSGIPTSVARTKEEIVAAISALVPKLESARLAQVQLNRRMAPSYCSHCD